MGLDKLIATQREWEWRWGGSEVRTGQLGAPGRSQASRLDYLNCKNLELPCPSQRECPGQVLGCPGPESQACRTGLLDSGVGRLLSLSLVEHSGAK